MAIVKMNKLSVIGMRTEKKSMLKRLMNLGAVEVKNGAEKLQNEEWNELVERDGDEEIVSEKDKNLQKVQNAIAVIGQYGKAPKPLFAVRKAISRAEYDELAKDVDKYSREADEINELNDEYNATTVKENAAQAMIDSLKPWESYELPLEQKSTDVLKLKIGTLPPDADVKGIYVEMEENNLDVHVAEVNRDKNQTYAYLWCFAEEEDRAMEIAKSHGFVVTSFGDLKGTVTDNIKKFEAELKELASKKVELLKQIEEKTEYLEDLEFYHDMLVIARDEAKIRSSLLNTKETFTFDGWVPVAAKEELERVLSEYLCWYEFSEPEEDDEIPVVLHNNKFVKPLEFITGLYSLPSAREPDPTAIFTLFYIVFFGMMFADIGYGIILFAATFIVLKKFKLTEGGVTDLMKVLCYCGISSAVFGVLFGSFFGDLITVVGKQFFGKTIALSPIWLDPMKSSMTLLVVSCALGVVHLFVGMGIDAYKKIKAGDTMAAVNDDFVWYVTVLGIVLWLFGSRVSPAMPKVGMFMTIGGFAAAIIIPIFMNKGAGKALGLWNIYSGVTGNLSDVLSYSRLLGLGLASASIAQVVNFLASLVGGGRGAVGVILFIVIEIAGHLLNFAINALGSFVHSARLQYVEFFGRFFDGGGEEFKPFENNTKYVRIIEEGK